MNTRKFPLARDTLLWALGGVCQVHRVPFDPNLIIQQFPPPYSLETLEHTMQALKFKAGVKQVSNDAISQLTLPCLVLLNPSLSETPAPPEQEDPAQLSYSLALLIKADSERVLLFEPGKEAPTTLPLDEFSKRYQGTVVLAIPEVSAVADEDADKASSFGFKWFIPELFKHKIIWRDVLAASLIIQLMALATPLFTQVVIDKVVVHHTLHTLIVIGIALAVFMIFTAALSWVRQYLVLHTGNRVDAVLGQQVFEHLFKLPPRYFEH